MDGELRGSIKAATLLRDTLVATVSANPGEPATSGDLRRRTCIMALGASINQVDNALRQLSRDGLLQRVRVFRKDEPTAKYGYIMPNGDVRPTTVAPKATNVGTPAICVDLVKSTGRLRIEFQGLLIEIGVVG